MHMHFLNITINPREAREKPGQLLLHFHAFISRSSLLPLLSPSSQQKSSQKEEENLKKKSTNILC